mmetsp:Transcript_67670/g.195940  ORF Transcript_67670/g.195940 Transcript_67670/m.195940 type:complete len:265 (+) Transcript_67670:956-1750(+)
MALRAVAGAQIVVLEDNRLRLRGRQVPLLELFPLRIQAPTMPDEIVLDDLVSNVVDRLLGRRLRGRRRCSGDCRRHPGGQDDLDGRHRREHWERRALVQLPEAESVRYPLVGDDGVVDAIRAGESFARGREASRPHDAEVPRRLGRGASASGEKHRASALALVPSRAARIAVADALGDAVASLLALRATTEVDVPIVVHEGLGLGALQVPLLETLIVLVDANPLPDELIAEGRHHVDGRLRDPGDSSRRERRGERDGDSDRRGA